MKSLAACGVIAAFLIIWAISQQQIGILRVDSSTKNYESDRDLDNGEVLGRLGQGQAKQNTSKKPSRKQSFNLNDRKKTGFAVGRNDSLARNIPNQPGVGQESLVQKNEQRRRRDTLRRTCSRLGLNRAIPSDDNDLLKLLQGVKIYFSDRYKLLACEIPKVGCTNFKKVLLVAEGLTNESNPNNVASPDAHEIANSNLRLSDVMNVTEIRRKLREYYKIITVRDPAHRVLSAFRNKFVDARAQYFVKMGKQIHRTLSNDSSPLKFEEFIRYIADSSHERNAHWDFYNELCNPCTIRYDYVAKLETISEDIERIWAAVGISKSMPYPESRPPNKTTNDEEMNKYYGSNTNLLRTVYNVYKLDHMLFDYPAPYSD